MVMFEVACLVTRNAVLDAVLSTRQTQYHTFPISYRRLEVNAELITLPDEVVKVLSYSESQKNVKFRLGSLKDRLKSAGSTRFSNFESNRLDKRMVQYGKFTTPIHRLTTITITKFINMCP